MTMTQDRPNPMRELLQQQMGLDAFALDGEAAAVDDSWLDERRAVVVVKPKAAPKPVAPLVR